MATDKRERQRENRAAKQEEHNKTARKEKVMATAKRAAVWIVVGMALVLLANIVWG
jgi:hypothetical protein